MRAIHSKKGAIEGNVTDAKTGEPMQGVTIVFRSGTEQRLSTTISDQTGSYGSDELDPGQYTIEAYYADLVVDTPDVPVLAGFETRVDLVIDQSQSGSATTLVPPPP